MNEIEKRNQCIHAGRRPTESPLLWAPHLREELMFNTAGHQILEILVFPAKCNLIEKAKLLKTVVFRSFQKFPEGFRSFQKFSEGFRSFTFIVKMHFERHFKLNFARARARCRQQHIREEAI